MEDIQELLSKVRNTFSYFRDFTLEACFTAELQLVNAQHSAGKQGNRCIISSLLAGQFIKLRYRLLEEMVGGEYLMNVKLHSNGSQKSN